MDKIYDQVELKNIKDVLGCIERRPGETSRAGAAKALKLSRTTVSAVVARLIAMGLVEEREADIQGRGRPGIPLTPRTDVWYALGAVFEAEELIFVLTDQGGEVVERHVLRVPRQPRIDPFLRALADGFRYMIPRCPGRLLPLLGVGVPGTVEKGVIIYAADMDWRDVHVDEYLFRETGCRAAVMNRHWTSALGEYRKGAGMGSEDLIYVGIATGIVAAFVFDGRLRALTRRSAGEIGHTVVEPNGPLCDCGRRGCLQAMASERALLKEIEAAYAGVTEENARPGDGLYDCIRRGAPLTAELICREAGLGNGAAEAGLSRVATYLGLSVGNLINMFNPQTLVIGGTLADAGGEPLVSRIARSISEHASADAFGTAQIKPRALGRDSGAIGAALLVLDQKLELIAGSEGPKPGPS